MKGYVHRGLLRLDPSQAHSSFTVWANPKSGEPSDWIEVEVTQIGVCGVKSLEELAEKARLAFFDNDTSKCENWNKIGEANKEWWRTVTLAIIREVLGPVTEQEANDAFTTYNKHPSNNDVASFRAALNSIFASRLSHYTRTASPVIGVDVTSGKDKTVEALIETATGNVVATRELPDDEVDRVAREVHRRRREVYRGEDAWDDTDEALNKDRLWDTKTTLEVAGIAAMSGGTKWGVWNCNTTTNDVGWYWWRKNHGEPRDFVTTDEEAAHALVNQLNCEEGCRYEVREYTPPAAEIPKEAIAEFKKAFDFYACDGHDRAVEMGLTAAIPHLQKEFSNGNR